MEQSNFAAESGSTSASLVDALNRGKEAIGGAANQAMDAAASDLESLRRDLDGLKNTMTTFMSQTGQEAIKSAREVSAALAEEGAEIASSAAARGKSLVGDIEDMARSHPLATLAGAVAIGMLLSSFGRRH